MELSNKVCIKSAKGEHWASNSVLNTVFDEIKSGNDYCAYIAIGSSTAPTQSGQKRLFNYLTHKKARVISSNFDPSLGECYIETQIELAHFELAGQIIGEVGLSAHDESNPIIVNRAVFSQPIKKDGEQLAITVFFFAGFNEGEIVTYKGENELIKSLFCVGTALKDTVFTLFQPSTPSTILPCEFSFTENGIRIVASAIASEDYQFILCANGKQVVKFDPQQQFLCANTVSMTAVSGEIKPPSRYTLDITRVSQNGVDVDLSKAQKLLLPTGVDSLDFRFDAKLKDDCEVVTSTMEKFVMLVYPNDIVVLDLSVSGQIKFCNTVEVQLGNSYCITDYGDIFCLDEDKRTINAFRLVDGVYKKEYCEPSFAANMDFLRAALSLNGRISLCGAGIESRQVVFYDVEFVGDRYMLMQSRTLTNISSIKKLHAIADGYFFVEFSGVALASVTGNVTFQSTSIGYTQGNSFKANGYILSIINNTSGLLQTYYYNRRVLVRLPDTEPSSALTSSFLWGQQRENDILLQYYYAGTEESTSIIIDEVLPPHKKVFAAGGYIFILLEGGAVRVWSLECKHFIIRSNLFSNADYDVTYDYKHPMPFSPSTPYSVNMEFRILGG